MSSDCKNYKGVAHEEVVESEILREQCVILGNRYSRDIKMLGSEFES